MLSLKKTRFFKQHLLASAVSGALSPQASVLVVSAAALPGHFLGQNLRPNSLWVFDGF